MTGKKKQRRFSLTALALLFMAIPFPRCPAFSSSSVSSLAPVPLSDYLEYARASADWVWRSQEEILKKWRQSFDPESVFGYRPPGGLLETAAIYAHLFETEKKKNYAERAKKILLTYGDFRAVYPTGAKDRRPDYEEGVPALPDFFTVMRYIRAFDTLRRLNVLNQAETEKIEAEIAHSVDYLLRSQEWGTMNRAILRAESLAWAVRAMPSHPRARIWEMQRRALGDDNWGNWQIEDATIYNGVWLYSLLGYADALSKREELLKTPEMYYYAHYYLRLLSPAGMVPDFGDANWLSNWAHYLVFFEAAAATLRDPHLKWAATTIGRKFIDFEKPTNVGLGLILLDCARWGSDAIPARPPTTLSGEVLEDVQGKKIVFRNGWAPASTYLLLNYRDEGDGGLNFRDYLRDTIPVEEEKMTHGHSDENSLVLLMSGGSILLHDAGYRDYMPSGPYGAYRQDYFHNRLCVRPEKIWMGQEKGEFRYSTRSQVPGQKVLDFLRNAGSYRRVRTQKVDFLTFEDFDYSRTRLIDDNWGYAWDRVIVYIKEPEMFVIFDIFKALREEWFTLANLWHAQKIVARGNHWYKTAYEKIQTHPLPENYHLLIIFPLTHYRLEGVEPLNRHYQEEFAIHQVTGQHFELGETAGFITLLLPHPRQADYLSWVDRIRLLDVEPERAALGVAIERPEKQFFVVAKSDLRMDMARDWRRPRYTYEKGRIRCGDFETNGDFLMATLTQSGPEKGSGRLSYTIVNLTKAQFRGQVLVEAKPSFFGLAFDGSPDGPGIGKLRYWRDELEIK